MNILKTLSGLLSSTSLMKSGTPISKSNSRMMKRRAVYKPFDYPHFIQIAKDHEKIHWTEDEIKLDGDVRDWKTDRMTAAEKYQVTEVLKLFTQQDMTVAGFYEDVVIPYFRNNDVLMAVFSFVAREMTHIRAYALLNDTLGLPESDYSAFMNEKALAEKIDFAMQADPTTIEGMALSLVKSVINEGLSLFGSFVPLLNYQRRGLMKGMGTIVEWSCREETAHTNTITLMFREWAREHPWILTDAFKKRVYDMFREAISLEDAFVDKIYEMGPVEGLSKEDLKTYLRYLADFRLLNLGFKANWGIKENPVEWLDWLLIALDHSNFFEKRSTEYEINTAVGGIDYGAFAGEQPKIQVFGWYGCKFCEAAKTLLDVAGLKYQWKNLATKQQRSDFFDELGLEGKERTAPQIYIGDVRIGGYDALRKYLKAE